MSREASLRKSGIVSVWAVGRAEKVSFLAGLLLFCFALSLSACQESKGAEKNETKKASGEKKAAFTREVKARPIHASEIKQGEIAAILSSTATLEAEEKVTILAQVKGLATKITGPEGTAIKKGQPLALLSNPYLQIADDQLTGEIKKLKADLDQQSRLATKGYVSKETVEQLRFQVEQKQTQRKQTQEDLRNLRILATITGTVTKQLLRRGSWIMPNAEAFWMEDPASLVAIIAVPEKYFSQLKTGLEASLRSEALGLQKEIKGEVIRIAPVVDSKTGTVNVVLGKLKPIEALRGGMFVAVSLVLERKKNVPLVPKESVLYEDNKAMVYRIEGKEEDCKVRPLETPADAKKGKKGKRGEGKGSEKQGEGQEPREGRKKGKKQEDEPRKSVAKTAEGPGQGSEKGKKGGKKGQERDGCRAKKVFFQKGIEDERFVEVLKGLELGQKVVSLGQEGLQNNTKVRVVQLRK